MPGEQDFYNLIPVHDEGAVLPDGLCVGKSEDGTDSQGQAEILMGCGARQFILRGRDQHHEHTQGRQKDRDFENAPHVVIGPSF